MNWNDYKSLKIGDYQLKKLVRASDCAVLFNISRPQPESWIELEYDGNQSSIFVGTLYAGYFGGQITITWGTEQQTVNVPSGGQGLEIRRDGMQGITKIRFGFPSEFFIPKLTSRTMLGIYTLRDGGNNLRFRNTLDSGSATRPGCFNWTNLNTLDFRRCTQVPYVTMNNFFDSNTNLSQIIIPKDMESAFLSNSNWNKYSAKFVVV